MHTSQHAGRPALCIKDLALRYDAYVNCLMNSRCGRATAGTSSPCGDDERQAELLAVFQEKGGMPQGRVEVSHLQAACFVGWA